MGPISPLSWRVWSAALGALLVLWPYAPSAAAEPVAEDAVEATFERGVAAADAGRWQEAARAFAQVCERAPTPNALLNLATARYQLEQPLAALAALDELDALPEVTAAEQRTADKMRQHVGSMVARLAVEVQPREAEVRVDGRLLHAQDRESYVLPGPHQVDARAEGLAPASVDLELASGERRTLRLTLLPVEPPAEEPPKALGAVPAARPGREDDDDDRHVRRRRRWLWSVAALVVAGAAGAVVATQVGGDPGCTSGSAGVALGGCSP